MLPYLAKKFKRLKIINPEFLGTSLYHIDPQYCQQSKEMFYYYWVFNLKNSMLISEILVYQGLFQHYSQLLSYGINLGVQQ